MFQLRSESKYVQIMTSSFLRNKGFFVKQQNCQGIGIDFNPIALITQILIITSIFIMT